MNPNTDTHNKDDNLTTNSFGNRVHFRKDEPAKGVKVGGTLEQSLTSNPMNHDYTTYGSVRTSEKGSRRYKGDK